MATLPQAHPISRTDALRTALLPWWAWVWTLNLAILAITYGVKADYLNGPWLTVAVTWESTIGNWWSAMLMLAVAVLGFTCASKIGRTAPPTALAFASAGLLGLILSSDELGSLHETIPEYFRLSRWLIALPFLLLACPAIGQLWRDRRRAGATWWVLLAGFGMLAAMEPLENLEVAYGYPLPRWMQSRVIEEGLEIVAVTVLIVALLHGSRRLDWRDRGERCAAMVRSLRWIGVLVMAAALPFIAIRYAVVQDGALDTRIRGDFGIMPVTLLFAAAGWACALRGMLDRQHRLRWIALAVICAAASIEAACNLRYKWFDVGSVSQRVDVILLWTLPALGMVAALIPPLRRPRVLLGALGALLIAIGVVWVYKTPISQAYTAAVAFAALLTAADIKRGGAASLRI